MSQSHAPCVGGVADGKRLPLQPRHTYVELAGQYFERPEGSPFLKSKTKHSGYVLESLSTGTATFYFYRHDDLDHDQAIMLILSGYRREE